MISVTFWIAHAADSLIMKFYNYTITASQLVINQASWDAAEFSVPDEKAPRVSSDHLSLALWVFQSIIGCKRNHLDYL